MKEITVLHVCESFEGGVAFAVANYLDSLSEKPYIKHVLLCNTRSGKLDRGILDKFSTVSNLPKSPFRAIKTVQRTVDKLRPDVVHCHSSFGGVYGRVGARKFPVRVIYTPHCYAFERLDISKFMRGIYYSVEKYLGRWTDVVAGCSERERDLAEKIGGREGFYSVFVPNISSLPGAVKPKKREALVMGVGRLAPQKDPKWFAEVAKLVKDNDAKFVWIGDGGIRYFEILEDAGVEVMGWVSQKEVNKLLSEAKVYLHSGRWEGFPITILDAEKCGLAIVAREADYLEGMPQKYIVSSPRSAAKMINQLLESQKELGSNLSDWKAALKDNNPTYAAKVLTKIYKCDTIK